ncbi:CGNR zinc finger domain-containing protein [aff. Roholtiella sp. LEGE 12411]|uniref:CGNR zinc finger domain-containing protein n=1 Tax=aff. Roholtiella sp. LEGE 12411 TaxID=1828822 RepID=UPI00187E479F|nr:ABATE domain-containing protein [aff. Roholtiella sp. LEGE 12411]MBE9034171.1 CGNR zinc finger domain-containing protein [aff. Roholtiella sp. LEGE 12411]
MVKLRPAPFFIAGHLALDFLNTIAAPQGEPIEWLSSGLDLLDWLERAKMLDVEVKQRFRTENSSDILDSVAKEARELREWMRGFVTRHAGHPIGVSVLAELDLLNQLLERDKAFQQIEAARSEQNAVNALVCKKHRYLTQPEQLLQIIAEEIANYVCTADFTLMRRCENPTCTLWFYDTTKSHARRWCSMSLCGNRSKAAAYRTRAKRV